MRLHILTAVLIGGGILPGLAQAQISHPIFKGEPGAEQNVVYKPADQASDLQHGKKLRVTLNNSEISGIVVRVDKATRKIYLRTEPGSPPQAFSVDDVNIKKVEKVAIKQVAFRDDRGIRKQEMVLQDIYQPEIQQIEIRNGNKRTISYVAPTLSPGEKEYLVRMEAAENELGRLEGLVARQDQVLDTDIAIQAETLRTQELLNVLLWKHEQGYFWGFGGANLPWPGALVTALPSAARVGPTVFPNLPVASDALVKAQNAFAVAQSHAYLEEGRLVAVVVDEPKRMDRVTNE